MVKRWKTEPLVVLEIEGKPRRDTPWEADYYVNGCLACEAEVRQFENWIEDNHPNLLKGPGARYEVPRSLFLKYLSRRRAARLWIRFKAPSFSTEEAVDQLIRRGDQTGVWYWQRELLRRGTMR